MVYDCPTLNTLLVKMNLTKTQKIIGGVVTGLVVLGGGIYAKVQYDIAAKKEAERIAYENRPIVDQECVMNGYGQGSCNFTNTGKSSGAVCGNIVVNGPGTVSSGKLCSGQVEPSTTLTVEFTVPEVNELCDNGFNHWTEKCDFGFVEDETQKPQGLNI